MLLNKCYIPEGIDLSEATVRTLHLTGCHVGAVRVSRATINGVFTLSGTYLDGNDGPALTADGLTVISNMFCDDGFYANGKISLTDARIGGMLTFWKAHLNGKNGPALTADGLTVARDMYCDHKFESEGTVNLTGANIGGILSFNGAHLNGKEGAALNADTLTVTAEMICANGQADGTIHLARASLGALVFENAYLNGKNGPALFADQVTVSQNFNCQEQFRADGQIRLVGARIGGQFFFQNTHLNGKNGPALTANGLTVILDMYFLPGFQADGEINLENATIGGALSFSGAHLKADPKSEDGCALHAYGLTVRDMYCAEGFEAEGEVNLENATIARMLDFRGAHLKAHPKNEYERALNAYGLTVRDLMCGQGFKAEWEINLENAKIGTLFDDPSSWPSLLRLDGLAYDNLSYLPARERLRWLKRSWGYSAQSYEQLARYYRRLGHDEQARRVLLAKQRRRTWQRPWWLWWWGWLQDALAGYGYAPGRALLLLAGAFAAGWLVFSTHHPAPVGPGPHSAFNAALYTLDVLIPAPALGQANDWDPQGIGLPVAAGLHALGWLLAITVIAAITRSFSRN